MGNTCCQKSNEDFNLKTLEADDRKRNKDKIYNKDNYPHDSDSGFKSIKNNDRTKDMKPITTGSFIEE